VEIYVPGQKTHTHDPTKRLLALRLPDNDMKHRARGLSATAELVVDAVKGRSSVDWLGLSCHKLAQLLSVSSDLCQLGIDSDADDTMMMTSLTYVMTSLQVRFQLGVVLIANLRMFFTSLSPSQHRHRHQRHRCCLATLVASSCTSLMSTTTAPSSTSRRLATTLFTLATTRNQVSYYSYN